ncbi:MAG: hypothetical protein V3T58_02965 [Candidatus Hydrothermarchaeales archaeon]
MKKALILTLIVLLSITTSVHPHPGRTDQNGCHTCRTNCESSWGIPYGFYHRHNPVRACFEESHTTTSPPPTTAPPTTTPPPTTQPPTKPKIVVLANSIDYELASDFFGFLGNKGMEVVHSTTTDFDQYKLEKFIVILGGPDAPEGVGDVVGEVLMNSDQNAIREQSAKKMYVKTNIWTTGQRVMVIAGSGRDQTKEAHQENRNQVAADAGA